MQCICGKELKGKQQYCSGACRVKASRERSVTGEGVSVTGTHPEVLQNDSEVLQKASVTVPSVTDAPSVTSKDDIYSEEYDTSEAGFKRRNRNWSDFKSAFRADTMVACKRLNKRNLADKIEYMGLKRDAWDGVSAVRGQVEA